MREGGFSGGFGGGRQRAKDETIAINEYNEEFFFFLNNDRNILVSLLNFYVF